MIVVFFKSACKWTCAVHGSALFPWSRGRVETEEGSADGVRGRQGRGDAGKDRGKNERHLGSKVKRKDRGKNYMWELWVEK